ncbi:MAG: hypothetical protein M9932_17655 [Xanthobacteraceae bacterium]|nr:hypothetical protein [Xanthobacteraceae bacterium]
MERIRNEIVDNVRIATKATGFEQRYSHLTGGFDSRLILSAIRNQNLEEIFHFSCIENSADWEIAGQLSADLGLQFAPDRRLRGAAWSQNYFESITRMARRSCGSLVAGVDPSLLPENSLLFQGGYGEVGRTFNSFYWDGDQGVDGLGYLMWRYASYPKFDDRTSSIWADGLLDEAASKVLGYAAEASSLGLPKDFATNYIYVEGRNRHWIGLTSYYAAGLWSQFDPLYSQSLVSTPSLLDFEHRKANFIGFDLMRSFSSDLLEFPFDRPRVGWLYKKERGPISQRAFSGKWPEVVRGPTTEAKPWPGKVDIVSEQDINISRVVGLSSLAIFGVRNYGTDAIKIVQDSDELRNIYRVENLSKRWNDGQPKTKEDFSVMNDLITTLALSGYLTEK